MNTTELPSGPVERIVSLRAREDQNELLKCFAVLADEMGMNDVADELRDHAYDADL